MAEREEAIAAYAAVTGLAHLGTIRYVARTLSRGWELFPAEEGHRRLVRRSELNRLIENYTLYVDRVYEVFGSPLVSNLDMWSTPEAIVDLGAGADG